MCLVGSEMCIRDSIYKDSELYDSRNFNMERIELEKPDTQDLDIISELIQNHFTFTSSEIAKKIINNWKNESKLFVKVMPIEYKLALEKLAQEKINQIIS